MWVYKYADRKGLSQYMSVRPYMQNRWQLPCVIDYQFNAELPELKPKREVMGEENIIKRAYNVIIWYISSSSSYDPHTNKFNHINYVDLCFYPNLSQRSNTFLKHDDDDKDVVLSIYICRDDITQPIYKSIYVIWAYILSWDWARNVRKRRIRIRKLKTKKQIKKRNTTNTPPQNPNSFS